MIFAVRKCAEVCAMHLWGFLWVCCEHVRLKGVLISDLTGFAKLLSSRVWEWCCILDASWYCRDCKICANVMVWNGIYCGLSLHVPFTNEVEHLFLYWLTVCFFFPFVTLPVQVLFPIFFISISSPRMQILLQLTNTVPQTGIPDHGPHSALSDGQGRSVLGKHSNSVTLFLTAVTSTCIMAMLTFFILCVALSLNNKAYRYSFSHPICTGYLLCSRHSINVLEY